MQITLESMPKREGVRPETTDTNPHMQLNQQPEDLTFIKNLQDWAFKFTNITKRKSGISVPGSIAMWMNNDQACKNCDAFLIGTEFAHFHPHPDYSMHLGVPTQDGQIIIDNGWGEWHPLITKGFLKPNFIMLYAPRNEEELEVCKFVLQHSYDFAKGKIK